jgi:hypothetical protein
MRYIRISAGLMVLCTIILVLFPDLLHAQNSTFDAQNYAQKSFDLQKKGMIVLGSWATLNLISGSTGYFLSENDSKYFHQMNAGWNIINLGIAGFALYNLSQSDATLMTYPDIITDLQSLDKILLFNAGLDLGYMAAGAWLWERGLRKKSSRLRGYGKSLLLQGGFLLAFDLILYLMHSPLTNELIKDPERFQITSNGFRIYF